MLRSLSSSVVWPCCVGSSFVLCWALFGPWGIIVVSAEVWVERRIAFGVSIGMLSFDVSSACCSDGSRSEILFLCCSVMYVVIKLCFLALFWD